MTLGDVFSGSSFRNLQKMEYKSRVKSRFQKSILNPVRFNVWQEKKRGLCHNPDT